MTKSSIICADLSFPPAPAVWLRNVGREGVGILAYGIWLETGFNSCLWCFVQKEETRGENIEQKSPKLCLPLQ